MPWEGDVAVDAPFANVGGTRQFRRFKSVGLGAGQVKDRFGMGANARDVRITANNMQEYCVYMEEDWLSLRRATYLSLATLANGVDI